MDAEVSRYPGTAKETGHYEAKHVASRTVRGDGTHGTYVGDVNAGECGERVAVATDRTPVGARDRRNRVGEGPLVCTGVQWWIGREELRRHVASLKSTLHHRAKELCREGS